MRKLHATYKVTTEPTAEPITLDHLKTSVRVLSCDFDTELSQLLTAGRRQVENDSQRKLVTQTLRLYMDAFPDGNEIELRLPPVQSVTSIQYIDESGNTQTFSSTNYTTDLNSTPPRIWLNDNATWPNTEEVPNAVWVTFVAGYGAASAVPAEAKLAITQYVRSVFNQCDGKDLGPGSVYANLINLLSWTAYSQVQ